MRPTTLLSFGLLIAAHLHGSTIYTHSANFFAALSSSPTQIEDFATANDGQVITDGTTVNGLTYGPFTLAEGATTLDITNRYGSISGNSLGADHTSQNSWDTYFHGNEGTSITFSAPVTAVGVFFNGNESSGLFAIVTSEGSVVNDASFLESSALSDHLIFNGLISNHSFDSIIIYSVGDSAVYNVAEIVSVASTPEPSTLALTAGFIVLIGLRRRLARVRPA